MVFVIRLHGITSIVYVHKIMDYKIFQMMPYIGEKEINQMADSVRKNWITEGPKSQLFIKKMLEYTGAKHGVLANNGTIALYLALQALGIKEGDEVIVTDFSFYASASTIEWCGATPVFIDIACEDFNMIISQVESKITKRTKAIMPVHIYGQSVDMDPLLSLANQYGLKVVEDACQGLGVLYKGNRHTGTMGDVGCFSFYADKTITTAGEGGMVVTNNEALYEKMRYFRNQGRTNSGTFIHSKFGVNFRLSDIATSFGLAQLDQLDYIIKRKLENYHWYQECLKDIPEVELLREMPYTNFVPFRVNLKVKNLTGLMEYMIKHGIQTRGCFYPLHKQPIFEKYHYSDDQFPNSLYAYENAMSLPVHLGIKKEHVAYICSTIKTFYHH